MKGECFDHRINFIDNSESELLPTMRSFSDGNGKRDRRLKALNKNRKIG